MGRNRTRFMIRKYTLIMSIFYCVCSWSIAQEVKTFKELKQINCEDVNENSPKQKQLQCLILDVVNSETNYSLAETRRNDVSITTPNQAWEALLKLYPKYKSTDFNCWTKYHNYYIFSVDKNVEKKNCCLFLTIIYIPIGGKEFWHFSPH